MSKGQRARHSSRANHQVPVAFRGCAPGPSREGMVRVSVKKAGANSATGFVIGDVAELKKLAEEEFGPGRLKTNEGAVVGSAFSLVDDATLIWDPPVVSPVGTGNSKLMEEVLYRLEELEMRDNKSATTTQHEQDIGKALIERAEAVIDMATWHAGESGPLPVPVLTPEQQATAITALMKHFPRQLPDRAPESRAAYLSLREAALARMQELRTKTRKRQLHSTAQQQQQQVNDGQQQEEGSLIENLHMQPVAVELIEALVHALQPGDEPRLVVLDTHKNGLRPSPKDGKIDCSILANTTAPQWASLVFMLEFKLDSADLVGAVGQLCQRARLVFEQQPSRQFVYGIAMSLSEVRIVLFQISTTRAIQLRLSPPLAMGLGKCNGLCSTELAPGVAALARLAACRPGQLGWKALQAPVCDSTVEGQRLVLGELLGSGSRASAHPSSVYRAQWGDKQVAVKFNSNARELAALRHIHNQGGHDHVIRLEHHHTTSWDALGDSYSRLLLTPVCNPLGPHTDLRILAQVVHDITDAVEFCIQKQVHPRDVSLFNIGEFNGRGVLFDFSVSKVGAQASSEGGAPWKVTGTPTFVSHKLLLDCLAGHQYHHDLHTHLESLYLSVRYAVTGGLPFEWVHQQCQSVEKWEAVRTGYMARQQIFGEEVDHAKANFLQQLHKLWYWETELPARSQSTAAAAAATQRGFVYHRSVTADQVREVCRQVLDPQ